MEEKDEKVDNFLKLEGLFSPGVFVFNEKVQLGFDYEGSLDKGVLHVFFTPGFGNPTVSQLGPLVRLMSAVRWKGASLSPNDFALVNLHFVLPNVDNLIGLIEKANPEKVILWMDKWEDSAPEIGYFQSGKIGELEVIRFHNLRTILQDEERKKQCWAVMKKYFGM